MEDSHESSGDRRYVACSKLFSASVLTYYFFFQDDAGTRYRLELRRDELCKLLVTWQTAMPSLSYLGLDVDSLPEWGPTPDELWACRLRNVTGSFAPQPEVLSDEEDDDGNDIDEVEVDEEEFDTLVAVERADLFRNSADVGNYWADDVNPFKS